MSYAQGRKGPPPTARGARRDSRAENLETLWGDVNKQLVWYVLLGLAVLGWAVALAWPVP